MSNLKILMVAAENDTLPGAKIGGVGDVIRDLPASLIKKGCQVQTVIPSYGFLSRLTGLDHVAKISVPFAGNVFNVEVLKYRAETGHADAFILHHALFSPKGDTVYCHDSDDRPFASDASKFAFFSAAVAVALIDGVIEKPDVLHCHDWHSAFLLILLQFMPQYMPLLSIHTVFSIHNLAMQGVRPFRGDASSFETWFPQLLVDPREINDTRVPHCINPMRAGIRLADKVHTVSPSYAQEILSPSDIDLGIYGGEGLERDLRERATNGDLSGILNGCEYPKKAHVKRKKPSKTALIKLFSENIMRWATSERTMLSAHWLAEKQLATWSKAKRGDLLLTSVGRVTEQKVRLLTTEVSQGVTALDEMMSVLGMQGTFVMLGSGDKRLEQALVKISAKHSNFIFLNGFSQTVADTLYECGDVFIMPSSFEPCGISQLLAMRAGQPCFVNRVGGLRDTVEPAVTGFAFEGANVSEQAVAMIVSFASTLSLYKDDPSAYQAVSEAAGAARFTWDHVAGPYIEQLYQE